VRFQGGRNAGHTIINDLGRLDLHLLPSGVFNPQTKNLIEPGVAFDQIALFGELDELTAAGVPAPQVLVSDRAQLTLSGHVLHDQYEEERLAGEAFGSTRARTAPFCADKAMKIGVQVGGPARSRLVAIAPRKTADTTKRTVSQLYNRPPLLLDELEPFRQRLLPILVDASELLHQSLKRQDRILLESQLGALRDVDHGIYPYSSSSSPWRGTRRSVPDCPPRPLPTSLLS
jgi:adenylosuccinate synthase